MIKLVVRALVTLLFVVAVFCAFHHFSGHSGSATTPGSSAAVAITSKPEVRALGGGVARVDSAQPVSASRAPLRIKVSKPIANPPLRVEIGKPAAQLVSLPQPAPSVMAQTATGDLAQQSKVHAQFMSLPLRFEPNRGQAGDPSQYIAQTVAYDIHFSANGAVLQLPGAGQRTLPITIEGADPDTHIEAARQLPGKSNYYLTADRSTWLTGIPSYAELHYDHIYPGINLVFYGNHGRLEYDFVVAPQTDPEAIALRIPESAGATITHDGDLQLKAGDEKIELLKPAVYQASDRDPAQRTQVDGTYRLSADNHGTLVKFTLGEYDRSKPLIIDPVLVFAEPAPSTQTIRGIQLDGAGNIYIAGQNNSTGALQVTKLANDGSTMLYSTSVSNSFPQLDGFAVDSTGRAYVVAYAGSGQPTTSSAYQATVSSAAHPYFAALDVNGSVTYASYFGGSTSDFSEGLAADQTGKAYIFGETCSADFPRTLGATPNGCYSPFVIKVDPSQSGAASLVYSNILGVSNAYALEGAVDASNNLYVAVQLNGGSSISATTGAFQYIGEGAPYGVYVEKLDPSGSQVYGAYLGPGYPYALAAEGSGAVYVTGRANTYDFPTTAGAFDTNYAGAFLTKLSPDGSTLQYSTFLAGPSGTVGNVIGTAVAVAPGCSSNCSVYFGGWTSTNDMPLVNPIQNANLSPYSEAFFGQMNATGSQASFLTYLGGTNGSASYYCADDSTCSPYMTADASGNMYIAGYDYSSDFPLTSGQTSYNYVAKVSPSNAALALPVPSSITFPYGQPVGLSTVTYSSAQPYFVDQTVAFRNMGSAPISITGISFQGTDFTETDSCSNAVPAGGICHIAVRFTPTRSGTRTDTMTISSNAPNGPTVVPVSGTAVDTGVLQLKTTNLDFGTVNLGSTSSQSFTVNNIGNTSMQISQISVGVPYTETDDCPNLLAVGTSCTVTVTFTPSTAGYVSGIIYIYTDSYYYYYYASNYYITLTGTGGGVGSPALSFSPTSLVFPTTSVGSVSSATDYNIVAQNTGTVPVSLTNFSITGDFTISSNGCTNNSLTPAQYCYIRVQFAPTATGTRTGALSITSSLSSTPQSISLTGTGVTGTQAVVLSTTNLNWPDQPVGTVTYSYYQNGTIYFTNVGTAPVQIYRVYDDAHDFHVVAESCSGSVRNPGDSCTVNMEFVPTQVGNRTGTLTIVDSAPGSPHTVAMSGNGLTSTQVAVLKPPMFSFGDQVTNTISSSQLIYLYNSGNVPMTVSNVQSDNSTEFAVSSNGCTSSVSAGSYCYVYVTFTPSAAGNRSAHLVFTDTAPGSPHSALLTGVGLDPTGALEVNPTSIPFGSQATMLSSGTVQVTVRNSGNSKVNLTGISASIADYVITSNNCGPALTPAATCSFNVAFNPTTTGARNGTITINSSNATSQGVDVTGTGVTATKSLVVIAPSSMDWGTVALNASQSRRIFLRNIGTATINFTSIGGVSAPFTESDSCNATLAVNTSCYVDIAYRPTVAGQTTETLMITSDAGGSPQSVTVTGNGASAYTGVFYLQNGLQFDQVPTGSNGATQTLNLYNYTGSTATYGPPSVSSGFTLTSSSCATGGNVSNTGACSYTVQASPTATGLYSGTISVGVAGVPFTASLTGYGVTPQSVVNLSQDGMLFQDQVLGNTSGVQYVYVYNVGNSPVSFTASSLGSSTDFIIQNDYCGNSFKTNNPLQPNNYCYVGLQFQPGSAGPSMATLTINDSTGGHTVTLEGSGIAPFSAGEVLPPGLGFLDTTVGLTSGQELTYFYNTGNVNITFTANAQVCTATGDPCTASSDFALGPSGSNCTATTTVTVGSYCYQYLVFTPQSPGAKTAVLRINDSAGGPHYVQLSGNGVAAITSAVAGRTQWNFADTAVGASSSSDYIYITNTGNTPITVGTLMSSSAEFAISSNSCASYVTNPLPAGGQCYTYMTFTPTGSPGLRNATLSIPTSAGSLSVALQGNAIAGTSTLALEATQIDFGQVPIGVEANQYLYITNTGTLPVSLGTPTVSPTGEARVSSGCSTTLPVHSTCYIYVYMKPSQTGQRSATVTFNDDASGTPHQITVNAVGISNQVTLSQTNLDFGSIAMGAQSPNVYVYYNNDTSSTVTVSSVTLGGANPDDFTIYSNGCSGGVSANYYCYVILNFKPTATSTRSATLTLVDSTGTDQVVNLTGTGLPSFPIFSVFPSRLVFDSQPLNTTSYSQYVSITNKGTANLSFTGFTLQQPASDFAIYYNSCQGASVAPNQACYVEFTFTPSGTGSSSATLSIADNDSSSPQVINISGNGQNGADLALSGNANPQSAPPGGTATFTLTATNNGPQPADNVVLTMNSPTNASVQSITPSGITCTGTNTITCSISTLNAGASFSVVIVAKNTVPGAMTINAFVSTSSADPNSLNNSLTITSNAAIADLSVVPATAATNLNNQPAFAMVVKNLGPGTDDNIVATFDLNQFGFSTYSATQGSCAFNGSQFVCQVGSLASGATATITIAVQPPASGWSSIEAHATGDQYDPVPTNNLAHVTPIPEGYNTMMGTNVSVDTADPQTGALANIMFPTVTRPGITALAAMPPASAPSGYRVPRANQTFSVTSSAQFTGNLTVSLRYAPTTFWHPAQARLFHNESGVWVDRTAANAPGVISAVTSALSQFAIFEPLNQTPTANPGAAMVVAATAPASNVVQLDGSKSTDPDNDALTYKWSGPFPEGSGAVTGLNPKVTLPVGVSQLTLVVNDGEVDSSPVSQTVTVADFAVVANNSAVSVIRGQGANVTLALSPKFGAYNNPVALACGNLPSDLACQFAESSATPGANGSSVTLTIVAAQSAALSKHGSPRTLATWLLAMGMPLGFVLVTGDRKRLLARLGVLAIALLVLYMAGCGGAGNSLQTQTPPPPTSSTSTITVTGTSGSIQHSITLTVTRN